ncbi:MAG: helix-turn-helix transcriptional regulator [Candidatus Binataceae bacterium]|nr:helix-turn-helix transcriptional regulator [Candidatus Binataceae bacterium]
MELSVVGNIRTPFGEVELIPQDRNLLQASSVEPLRLRRVTMHLWVLLERTNGTWDVSSLVDPVLHLIDSSGHTSSIAGESIAAEVIESVTATAGKWAGAHPEAFECAALEAFRYDREGLCRELRTLRESLTCSAQAIESISWADPSGNSARLREYSQKMRSMASEVPTIQEIARAVPDSEVRGVPKLTQSVVRDRPVANADAPAPRDVTGARRTIDKSVTIKTQVFRQMPAIDQRTLGQLLRDQRKEMGLSQRELALSLGVKATHVAQLEADGSIRPSFQLLGRVAHILELDKNRLFKLAETEANSPAGARRPSARRRDEPQMWGAFARNRALLDRHNVKPQELKVLSQVSLMGKITGTEALLFILDAIRESEDTDE